MHIDAILEILHLFAVVVFVSPMVIDPFAGVAALPSGNSAGAASAARIDPVALAESGEVVAHRRDRRGRAIREQFHRG